MFMYIIVRIQRKIRGTTWSAKVQPSQKEKKLTRRNVPDMIMVAVAIVTCLSAGAVVDGIGWLQLIDISDRL